MILLSVLLLPLVVFGLLFSWGCFLNLLEMLAAGDFLGAFIACILGYLAFGLVVAAGWLVYVPAARALWGGQ